MRGRGTKKLSDVYVDAKVPRRERDAAPVIAVGGVVVWSPLVEGKWLEGGCGDLVVTARRA